MKILLFDNYDSFTFNLYQCVRKLTNAPTEVRRNDQVTLEEIADYDKIILSPGPGLPAESGILLPLIREYAAKKSILGVCLGHQAIAESFGGKLENLDQVYHGVATTIYPRECTPREDGVFNGITAAFPAGRYHSWVVSKENFPGELEVTAVDGSETIMALQHRTYDVQGVQFHPESIMTPLGSKMIDNFLNH